MLYTVTKITHDTSLVNIVEPGLLHKPIIIPGRPVPLQRPRFSSGHIYDSQKREKNAARIYVQNQYGNQALMTGNLLLIAEFYFETPKRTQSLTGKFHSGTPDTDNLVKWLCDILQGICFRNDSQIAQIVATKLYDPVPRTEFILTQIK